MADDIDTLLMKTQEQTGATCIVISHDIQGTFKIAHTIAMLYKGKIIEVGTPDKFRSSDNAIVQQFIHGTSQGPVEVV
jgi:phospholipid/cholesterol/gamma-HCH transport system ATP-binding protein